MTRRRQVCVLVGCVAPLLYCGPRIVDAVDLGPASPEAGDTVDAAPPAADARPSVVWPTASSSANSDPWLVANHDSITEMRPNLLLLDFYNPLSVAQVQQKALQEIDALAQSSKYHGYSGTAPAFLNYHLIGVVNLTDPQPPTNSIASTLLPVDASGNFDTNALFTAEFANQRIQIPDPANTAQYLTLCELFERGIINELWLAVGNETNARKPGLQMEYKQVYDAQNHPMVGLFNACTGYACMPANVPHCKVTTRIAHLDPSIAGPGCDMVARSIGIEKMRLALRYLADNASDFFNDDFTARYGTAFNSWEDLVAMGTDPWCTQPGSPCIFYPSASAATGTYPEGGMWRMDPFVQGCGNAHFPPNAQFKWDFSNQTSVESRCEHYAMRDAPDGGDLANAYTSATVTDPGVDCGRGWQTYLLQSIPGLGNLAIANGGQPMKNWWPFLFY